MNEPLKDWQQLQSDWQNYQPDIQQIKRKSSWVTWRMIFILAIDVIALVGYIPFLIFVVNINELPWTEAIWHVAMGVLIVIGSYFDFKIRLPILQMKGDTTQEVLKHYLQRVEAGVVIGRLGYWLSLIIGLFFIVWFALNFYIVEHVAKHFNLKFGLFGTIWIGLIAVSCRWYQRKKEKELAQLKTLWKEYLE